VVAAEVAQLNGAVIAKEKRLDKLHTKAIRGIILIPTVTTKEGMMDPFIMVLVASSMVITYNEYMGDMDILYNDMWDLTVLEGFQPTLDVYVPHCPLLGAQ
jgi:hypothetical protein